MTALAGLPPYVDLAFAAGLPRSIERHVGVRAGTQGWTDAQEVMSLLLLNVAGGGCVDDLRVLEKDDGFARLMRRVETYGLARRERRALERRWRKERKRAVPSPSATFRYLAAFHVKEEEKKRREGGAFIPAPNAHLLGLHRVNDDLSTFDQRRAPLTVATLDMDATLVESHKRDALHSYQGYKAYQPLNVYWHEKDMVVRSEFRDGNVPAQFENLRVLRETLAALPAGVETVCFRSDTAAYQQELLRYCAEGKNERFGVIPFAVSADVTPEFKRAVAGAAGWKPLQRRREDGSFEATGQEWAEVNFVPNWIGHSRNSPDYRFLAIREPLRQLELPDMPQQQTFPFPVMDFGEAYRYKVHGLVSNRLDMDGDKLIWWSRERCGRAEAAHSAMKEDFAGGVLPSGDFGENAAWWAIMILAYNLNSIMKRHALGEGWTDKRMKAIRFAVINLPGRVMKHARQMVVRIAAGHPSLSLLVEARGKILAMALAPG
jgi:hypothetical protein